MKIEPINPSSFENSVMSANKPEISKENQEIQKIAGEILKSNDPKFKQQMVQSLNEKVKTVEDKRTLFKILSPLLKTADQQIAFEYHSLRPFVRKEIVKEKALSDKEIEISFENIQLNQTSLKQLSRLIAELPRKEKIVSLDLTGLTALQNFMYQGKSILEGMSSLKTLILPPRSGFNQFEGIEVVGQTLENLTLSMTSIQSLKDLSKKCPHLKIMDAQGCNTLANIQEILEFKNLKILNFSGCHAIKQPMLKYLDGKCVSQPAHLEECKLENIAALKNIDVAKTYPNFYNWAHLGNKG